MDPVRFDSLARAFAQSTSRRRLLGGLMGGVAAGVLGRARQIDAQQPACPAGFDRCGDFCVDWSSDPRHCGGCSTVCGLDQTCYQGACTTAVCTTGLVECWGDAIDVRSDERNCGQCGELCAPGKNCLDCTCQEPALTNDACRSNQLRLWVNAFIPGFDGGPGGGLTSSALIDGVEHTIFETTEDVALILRADRDPDPHFTQTPFSSDANAPSLGQITLGVQLPAMNFDTAQLSGGRVAQLKQVSDGAYTIQCERSITPPNAQCIKLQDATDSALTFAVDCAWTVQRANPADAACPLDTATLAPVRIKGGLTIERNDETQLVEIRFTGGEDDPDENVKVSAFPAFEMYGRLDDGNQITIFTNEAGNSWQRTRLVDVPDALAQQCGEDECDGVVARMACGCGTGCVNGKECHIVEGSTQQCRTLDSYYVLTGSPTFEPTNDFVCADPRCPARSDCAESCREGYLRADGPVTVLVDGQPVYTSDPFGRLIVPPIGFRAQPGARVQVIAADSTNSRDGLRYLSLNRVDGPHGLLTRETRSDSGNRFIAASDGRAGIEIDIEQPASNRGSTICCRDQGQQVCVDRMWSTEHCGGCNQPCKDKRMVCLAGTCTCPSPLVDVGGTCVDPTQDDKHCGAELRDCTLEGKFCAQSSCVDAICENDPAHQVCDGVCVSIDDAEHCGYFCGPCPIPPHSKPICTAGVCDFECIDGFVPCNGQCVDPAQPENCGPSCMVCVPPVANARATCLVGEDGGEVTYQCGHSCLDGFHQCGEEPECWGNGDAGHCGSSCEQCAEGTSCFDGICCNRSENICNGICVDLQSSMENCGSCNTYCNYDQCCVHGNCGVCDACGGCAAGYDCIDGECKERVYPPPDRTDCPSGTVSDGIGGCIPIVVSE